MLDSLRDTKNIETTKVNHDEKELYQFIEKLRNPKEGKPEQWKSVRDTLIDKQKHGKFPNANKFDSVTVDSIRIGFKRNSKKYDKS